MRIVIIGNGVAGITAARHIRKKSDAEIFVISGESKYFFSRTALMYVYMGHMQFDHLHPYENWFWRKNKINLIQDWVSQIQINDKLIALQSGDVIHYDKLVLATGSKPMNLPIPGNNLTGVQSLYSRQDLEHMEQQTRGIQKAVVIGGGLIGIEMAEMLHSRGIATTIIVREPSYWANVLPEEESKLISKHILSRGVKLYFDTTVKAIEGSANVSSVLLSSGERLEADFAGITIGVIPNIQLTKETPIKTERGILVDEFLRTNIPDIYAAGDCAQLTNPPKGRKEIEPIWYTARKMGETVAQNVLGGSQSYDPGLWFNSAKFFDLEYQTYGFVPSQATGNNQLFWQDNVKEQALRIVFNPEDEVVGFNAIGLRLRQEICESWIHHKLKKSAIQDRLNEINFNPEFFGDLRLRTKLVEL